MNPPAAWSPARGPSKSKALRALTAWSRPAPWQCAAGTPSPWICAAGKAALEKLDVEGAIFLGCTFDQEVEEGLRRRGALIFPKLEGVPFDPYRAGLYTPRELYAGLERAPYEELPDALVYHWSIRPGQRHRLDATLASALHDHAIGDALDEFMRSDLRAGRTTVGVMGGHAAQRGTPEFVQAAELGRHLARTGRLVATGGGPGAMEAANLGAYLSHVPDAEFERRAGRV